MHYLAHGQRVAVAQVVQGQDVGQIRVVVQGKLVQGVTRLDGVAYAVDGGGADGRGRVARGRRAAAVADQGGRGYQGGRLLAGQDGGGGGAPGRGAGGGCGRTGSTGRIGGGKFCRGRCRAFSFGSGAGGEHGHEHGHQKDRQAGQPAVPQRTFGHYASHLLTLVFASGNVSREGGIKP